MLMMMAKVMVSQMKEMKKTRMVMHVWNESEVDKWINWKMNQLWAMKEMKNGNQRMEKDTFLKWCYLE